MEELLNQTSEEKTMNILFDGNNLYSSNTLLHFACLDYMKTYKKNMIPFDWIRYFLKKVQTYQNLFQSDLQNFYSNIDVDTLNIGLLASIYSKSLASIAVAVLTKDSIEFVVTDEDPVDLLSFYMETESKDSTHYEIYSNIKTICDKIENSNELLSKKELFERYMIDKFLDDYTPSNIIKTKKQQTKTTNTQPAITQTTSLDIQKSSLDENKNYDENLKGQETDVPVQKGKVTKLFIPKLMLPSPYPIMMDSSRINSDYRAKSLLKADETIAMFGKYKFKAVSYKTGFIEKRKKTKKPKPKFSFDF